MLAIASLEYHIDPHDANLPSTRSILAKQENDEISFLDCISGMVDLGDQQVNNLVSEVMFLKTMNRGPGIVELLEQTGAAGSLLRSMETGGGLTARIQTLRILSHIVQESDMFADQVRS